MKSSFTLKIASFLLCCFFSANAFAGHILATHITYTYISANTYKVQVAYYRDCQGLPAGQQATLCYSSATTGTSGTVTLNAQFPPFALPPFPYFPTFPTSCVGGTGLGIERTIYEGTLVLPSTAPDWILSYSTFPQNIGINQNFMFVSTKIDNLNYPTNSSAKYLFDPTFAFCLNQPAWDNFACTDADGDSLSYSLIPILDNTTVCPAAPFINPVPAFSPLQSSTPVTIDSTNGSLTFMPTMVGMAMVSVRVDEFRNGLLINSSTVEQVMYIVTNCIISGVENVVTEKVNIYPNPVSDWVYVKLKSNEENVNIEIFDLSGNQHNIKPDIISESELKIDMSTLPSGSYTVRVTTDDETLVRGFVKL